MIQIDNNIKLQRNKQYNDWSRKKPAYISLAIIIVIVLFCGLPDIEIIKGIGKVWSYLISLTVVSSSLFFFYRFLLTDISRFYPGMLLFSKWLKPTTRLLYSTYGFYTEEQKKDIRKKIKDKGHKDLETFKNKTSKNRSYVKRVDEAVSWLLEVTRFDNILFEYNCLYGFYRNLTAGVLVDALLLFFMAIVNDKCYTLPHGSIYFRTGMVLLIITIVLTALSYMRGMIFAKKMYSVFLNLDDNNDNY